MGWLTDLLSGKTAAGVPVELWIIVAGLLILGFRRKDKSLSRSIASGRHGSVGHWVVSLIILVPLLILTVGAVISILDPAGWSAFLDGTIGPCPPGGAGC